MANRDDNQSQPGIAVDSKGGAVIDPTRNVLDLVKAAVDRIDDLRDAETIRVNEKIVSEKEHTREIMALRAQHAQELREAEVKRIDAIRSVDVQAGITRDDRATSQASVLANQVVATADTLRNAFEQVTKLLSERIAALEKAQYEGVGKERVTDPIMTQLLIEMKAMRESQSTGIGRGAGLQAGWIYLLGGAGLVGAILGIISFFR